MNPIHFSLSLLFIPRIRIYVHSITRAAYSCLITTLQRDSERNSNGQVYAFAIGVAILMYGPQDREHNFVLNIFWAWWWPVEMLAYLFVGKCIKNERGAKSYFYLNRLPTLKHTQKHVYIQIMIR